MIRATAAQAAHFILHKTHLAGEGATDLPGLVRTLVALPAFEWLPALLACWVRHPGFEPVMLQAALGQARSLLRRPALRLEPALMAVDYYPLLQGATGRQRRQGFSAEMNIWEAEPAAVEQVARAIVEAGQAQPLTESELIAQLGSTLARELTYTTRGGRIRRRNIVSLALQWLEGEGLLLAAPVDGAENWGVESLAYAPPQVWQPPFELAEPLPEAAAQEQLVRAYLATFGPATEADVSFWTGLSKSETRRALAALTAETTLALVDGVPGAMLLLQAQAEALEEIQPPRKPLLNLLPADDPFVRAHKASRARLLAEPRLQRQIFDNADRAKPTILVDGRVVGSWAWERESGDERLIWWVFDAAPVEVGAAIKQELARLADFLGIQALIEHWPT